MKKMVTSAGAAVAAFALGSVCLSQPEAAAAPQTDKTDTIEIASQNARAQSKPLVTTELDLLARFIRLMVHYSAIEPKDGSTLSHIQICLTERSDNEHRVTALNGRSIRGLPLNVAVFADPKAVTEACHLAFFSKSEIRHSNYRSLQKSGVLTISDHFDFAQNGGAVEITFESNKIAFYVQRWKIKKSVLKPNSKFLRMATEIY